MLMEYLEQAHVNLHLAAREEKNQAIKARLEEMARELNSLLWDKTAEKMFETL